MEDSPAQEQSAEDEECCVICFEDLKSKGGAVPLPCNCQVLYCGDCWDRSLAASITACNRALCPSCRGAMRVDFDADQGRLLFTRAPASELGADAPDDGWRSRLYEQAKPKQIQLLQRLRAQSNSTLDDIRHANAGAREEVHKPSANLSEDGFAASQAECVCGSRLKCISVRERVLAFVSEESPVPPPQSVFERLMLTPPIVCDICDTRVQPRSRIWTCENGRRTMLHAVAYDVCESCFEFHAYGIDSATRTEYEPATDTDDIIIDSRDSSDEDSDDLHVF